MMSSEAPQIIVSALLLDPRNHFLIAKRPTGKRFAGMWELPGGKINPGESEQAALARELNEELGIDVTPSQLLRSPVTLKFNETGSTINLYECREWQGEPRAREGQLLTWTNSERLESYRVLSGLTLGLPALRQHYPVAVPA